MEKEVKFEELLTQLESLVKDLEAGNIDLDDAIDKYTLAMKLAKKCRDRLNTASAKVNKIINEFDQVEDFNIEE